MVRLRITAWHWGGGGWVSWSSIGLGEGGEGGIVYPEGGLLVEEGEGEGGRRV